MCNLAGENYLGQLVWKNILENFVVAVPCGIGTRTWAILWESHLGV